MDVNTNIYEKKRKARNIKYCVFIEYGEHGTYLSAGGKKKTSGGTA
jgi:hypothetical protein